MLKTRKRWISLILTLAMLVTFCVPFAGPAAAGASAYNTITSIPQFDSSAVGANNLVTATVQLKVDPAMVDTSSARIEVIAGDNAQLDIKEVTFAGSKNITAISVDGATIVDNATKDFTANPVKSFVLGFSPTTAGEKATVNFRLKVDAKDCAAGDIKLNVFSPTGQLDTNSVVVAKAAGGAVELALVGSVPTIGGDVAKKVTIRISENSDGALNSGVDSVKIKLPSGYIWQSATPAATTTAGAVYATIDGRFLKVTRNVWTGNTPKAAAYDISANIKVDDKDTAKMGDVVATVEGGNSTTVSQSELKVAIYADYGFELKVASVKELLAGKIEEQKTDKITIKEKIAGSLFPGRTITVKFPDWVKVVNTSDGNSTFNAWTKTFNSDRNKLTIDVPSTASSDKRTLEFKAQLSIEGNKTGDIVVVVSGAGIADTDIVVAKAVAPVTATSSAGDVKIGVQEQAASDITLTETKAGAIKQGTDRKLVISIADTGAKFAGTPKVEVTEGDLEIKKDNITISSDTELTIPIKSESIKASTIKISNIKLTLDRTVPEGALTAKIEGSAVIDNSGNKDNQFNTSNVGKFVVANCVTPAPGDSKVTAVLTANNAVMKVNGKDVALDAAPYIKNDRLYVSARFCANAFGVANQNIIWDGASKSATIMAGARVIQMKVGSNLMVVNGATVTMDTVPEIVDPGRVMLPIGWLAQALGASAEWDQATQTATLQL